MRAIRRFTVRTVLPEPIAPLGELAMNLRWAWHEPSRSLFASIDPLCWEQVHQNPARLLGTLPTATLEELARDEGFVGRVHEAVADLKEYLTEPRWYQDNWAGQGPAHIAYLSPEFGVNPVLPQYSGGLGILAGDHLKAASDLGVPITGVGLLYKMGYFKQSLSADGWQTETYPVLDPHELPLTLLREADGTPARVSIELRGGRMMHAWVWKADVGRVPLLLLDSDLPDNDELSRAVTDRLYGGGGEHRLAQEILLGIGGVRALRLYTRLTGLPEPTVFHTNEGHAGFQGLERIRELMTEHRLSFDEALALVRSGTVFTTHTPVPAGIDRFPMELARSFLASGVLGQVPVERVLDLGAEAVGTGEPDTFNMAVMGLTLAQRANGVSKLHGQTSRTMFAHLWPGFDVAEVPISSITNGVHAATWLAPKLWALAAERTGPDVFNQDWGGALADTDPERLWQIRRELRGRLVDMARARLRQSWLQRGVSPAELGWVDEVLNPDVLTIGFARRVPTYKRLTLMLRDEERLTELLLDPDRPIQIVVAGKAHPADDHGKQMIQDLVRFADDPAVRHRIVFLPNYDIEMAREMYPGCDLWLNNPLRPLEACGTSGMKVALNGGLNVSVRDGWWDELWDGENGWEIPTAEGVDDPQRRDDVEAAGLYDLLSRQVIPLFYERGEHAHPQRWMQMVAHTLRTLAPQVRATRMVRDYVGTLYVPAGVGARALTEDGFAGARELARWRQTVQDGWGRVRVDHVESSGIGDTPQLGERLHVRAFVSLGDLTPDEVRVQVDYGSVDEADEFSAAYHVALTLAQTYESGRYLFEGDVPLTIGGPFGYTVRILPDHPQLADPAELGLVVNAG